MTYVIACGDEGVQINEGTRLAVAGSGFRMEGFSEVVTIFKELFEAELVIASNEENEWVKQKLDLRTWEQVNASSQQHIQAVADLVGVPYAGFLPFSDPKELTGGIKGHMVRPHGVHFANKIAFTLGGGEQKYSLGSYLISADWVAQAPENLVKDVIGTQVEFYNRLAGRTLESITETAGSLGEETAEKNKAVLQKLGFVK
jgi:hypothetical protein